MTIEVVSIGIIYRNATKIKTKQFSMKCMPSGSQHSYRLVLMYE